MPQLDAQALIPLFPFHFLTIIRYIQLLLIIFLVLSPVESRMTFLLLLGVTAVLLAADVYGPLVVSQRFARFMIRVLAVALPVLMAGTGPDKSTRQSAGLIAGLGLPSIAVLLFFPQFDPSI